MEFHRSSPDIVVSSKDGSGKRQHHAASDYHPMPPPLSLESLDDGPLDLNPNAGAGLSSLFGSGAPEESSMSALSFQRTLAPADRKAKEEKERKAKAAAEKAAAEAAMADAAKSPPLTLFAALVQAFRSVSGAWSPVGQTGLALVGGPLPKAFQLVLYEPVSKRPLSVTTIAPATPLGVPSAQYVTLEDDAKQHWSVHLPSIDEASHLLQHATLVRALSTAAPAGEWIVQDVVVGDGHAALAGDAIGVRQLGWKTPKALQAPPPSPAGGASALAAR